MSQLNILKIGGGDGVDYAATIRNLTQRVNAGERWLLVHGASAETNRLTQAYGYSVQMITSPGGHVSRYTDARMIEIYAEAAERVNCGLVDLLQTHGVDSAGFGTASVIRGQRKAAIRAIRNGRQVVIRDDYSGRITGIDTESIRNALNIGVIPIIAPIAAGEESEALNVDGDLVAATIAKELGAERLVILSNVPGLLRDVDDSASLIPQFPLHELDNYQNYAQGRMKKKLIAAETAHVPVTILADSRLDNPIDAALNGGGTHITKDGIYVEHHT